MGVPPAPTAAFLGTEQENDKKALIISEYTAAQSALQQCGVKTEILQTSRLANIDGSYRFKLLCEHHYLVVWIDLPSPRQATQQSWKLIRQWLAKCQDTHVPAYLVGPRCQTWKEKQPQSLLSDKIVRESRHRWCHYGISLGESASLSEYVVYSTVAVEGSPCMCDIKDQHVKDWELKEAGLKVKKANMIEHFFYKLLRERLQPFGKCGEGKGPKSHSYHMESVEGVTCSHPVIGNLSLSSVRPHPPTLLSSTVDVDGRARSNGNVQLSIRHLER